MKNKIKTTNWHTHLFLYFQGKAGEHKEANKHHKRKLDEDKTHSENQNPVQKKIPRFV